MKSIAVIGKSEFTLGFKLTGIRNIIDTKQSKEDVLSLLKDTDVGIVIIDDETMQGLDEYTKEQVVGSISPVFVVVSESVNQGELRKMIIQSIGVDLMKDEDN
jgi:V/A-type H+/Na+-transporting ATPase subunit F